MRWLGLRSLLLVCVLAVPAPGFAAVVKSASADLNGDGKAEQISITIKDEFESDYVLKIGSVSVKGKLWEGIDGFQVVDIDCGDRLKEIAVHTRGPSDDYGHHLYWFDGKHIKDMGVLDGSAKFPGNGSVLVHRRIGWAFTTEKYVPQGSQRKLHTVPQDMYAVEVDAQITATVAKSFPIYATRAGGGIVAQLAPKSKITILAYSPAQRNSDGSFKVGPKDQYLIKSHTGLLGWASAKAVDYENLPDLPTFD